VLSRVFALAFGGLAAFALGCDSSDDRVDVIRDAATDAAAPPPPVDMLPRRDAQVGGEDVVPECQRTDPASCATGERCAVVIRRPPEATDYTIYEGCVEAGGERGLGDPCAPFGGLVEPYRAAGLTDVVYADPCGDGLFCAPDFEVRGLNTCQRACASPSVTGYTVACEGAGEYCGGNQPFQQVCRTSDGCDPSDPMSCGPGRGCYLRLGDDIETVISLCFPEPDMPVADGESCIDEATGTYYINACSPGASCWGPVRKPPIRWANEDYLCRRACDPTLASAGADAGDDDAGTAADGCVGSRECVDFAASGLDISNIRAEFGHCE
jgi:hypothetical protein